MSKLITVFGATGNQGGSVIRALLSPHRPDDHALRAYKIRGVTRDPSKPAALALSSQGVDMVAADLSDKQSILAAIRGSDAVFGVTNYWETGRMEHEVMQGRNLADAAKEAGVHHLIWSSLPYVSKITHNKLHNLHHFDSKAMVEEYIRSLNIPASFVMPAYFMSNVPGSIRPPSPDSPNSYSVSWIFSPRTQIPMLDVPADFGKFVAACLAHPHETKGTRVLAASGWFTPTDVVRAVEACTGVEARYHQVPMHAFGGSPELRDNLLMIMDHHYYGPGAFEGVERAQGLVKLGEVGTHARFSTFQDFLREVGL